MNWKTIETKEDIEELMIHFGGFHDSCIKELSYQTGTFVDHELGMNVANKPSLRILFQRQSPELPAVELEFFRMVEAHLRSRAYHHDTVIFGATFYLSPDGIWWADQVNWDHTDAHRDDATWIRSKCLRWRKCDNHLGAEATLRK